MTPRRAELLAIGSELLGPERLDTNGSFLSRFLGERGIAVRFRTIVGDDPDDLRDAFALALQRSDLIVATGGLGPTVDDLTREAVAGLLGLPLLEDAGILADIEARFRRHGYVMPEQNRRQAQVPRGAMVLPNRLGTAPGLMIDQAGRLLVLLPGVPSEMRQIVEESLLPRLPPTGERFAWRVYKIAGLTESEVDRRLLEVHRTAGAVAWTILASPGQIEIHLRERIAEAAAPSGIEKLEVGIVAALGTHLFGRDEETLELVVGRMLRERAATLAVAESLTGGSVARRLASIPGASAYFRGGAVCYSDDAKRVLCGVRPETLAAHGAVSAEVALEMASGVRGRLDAGWGLATTGFAGPEAGDADRPPGTLFLGLSGPDVQLTRSMRLPGDRSLVQERSTQAALDLLRRALLGAA